MTFKTEFPDYPAADMPALPPGFEDSSWHNDSCPSIQNLTLGLHIFVDYADASRREAPSATRYAVSALDSEGCLTESGPVLESDEWTAVLAAVARRRQERVEAICEQFVTFLRKEIGDRKFAKMKKINETDPDYADGACASHDFCDANMPMDRAFTLIVGRESDVGNDFDAALWNDAWTLARERHIGRQIELA